MKQCVFCGQLDYGLTFDIIDDSYYHDECLVNYIYDSEEIELGGLYI